MAYDLLLPKVGFVKIPDDISKEDLDKELNRLADAYDFELGDPEKHSIWSALTSGVKGYGGAALGAIGRATGLPELEAGGKKMMEEAEQAYVPATEKTARLGFEKGVLPGIQAEGQRLFGPLAQGLGRYAIPTVAGAAAEALSGGTAGAGVFMALDFPANYGEAVRYQQEVNPDRPVDNTAAITAALGQTALNRLMIPAVGQVPKAFKAEFGSTVDGLVKKIESGELSHQEATDLLTSKFGNYAKSIGANTAAVSAMGVGSEAIRRAQAGQDITSPEAVQAYKDQLEGGVVPGILFGGLGAWGKRGAEEAKIQGASLEPWRIPRDAPVGTQGDLFGEAAGPRVPPSEPPAAPTPTFNTAQGELFPDISAPRLAHDAPLGEQGTLFPEAAGPQTPPPPGAPPVLPMAHRQGEMFPKGLPLLENKGAVGPAMEVTPEGVARTPEQGNVARRAADNAAWAERTGVSPQREMFPEVTGTTHVSPEPEPTRAPTVLSYEALREAGLAPHAGFFKQLLGKDLSNPADAQAVADILAKVRGSTLDPSVINALHDLAGQHFYNANTMQMFGPKGGATRAADQGGRRGTEGTTSDVTPTGEGVPVPSGTESLGGTAGAKPSDTGRVVVSPEATGELGGGKGEERPAVAETSADTSAKTEPKKAETPAVPEEKLVSTSAKTPEDEAVDTLMKGINKAKGDVELPNEPEDGAPASPFEIPKAYTSFVKDDITNQRDHSLISEALQSTGKGGTPKAIADALRSYFTKMPRRIDGLINAAFDLAYGTPKFRRTVESAKESRFFRGMHKNNARLVADWVHQNLSKETDALFRSIIRKFEIAKSETTDAKLAQLFREALSGKNELYDETVKDYIEHAVDPAKLRKLLDTPANSLAHQVHPMVTQALMENNLAGALRFMKHNDSSPVGRIAGKLAEAVAGTKVKLWHNLTDENGRKVPGFYDPKTNTIHLDASNGLTSHVLLHEAAHAALSHALDDATNPLTRHLQQIYDAVKDKLDTAYGAQDLHEFASEAWSNPEFASKLKQIYADGSNVSMWNRFSRAVSNFFRRMIGMENKPLMTAFDEVDRVLDQLASPSPESRNAGAFYAPNPVKAPRKLFAATDTIIDHIPMLNDRQKGVLSNAVYTSSSGVKSFILSLLPSHAVGDLANSVMTINRNGRTIQLGSRFNDLIRERSGFENNLNKRGDAFWNKAQKVLKDNQATYDAFCDVVNDSTIARVDPSKPRSTYDKRVGEDGKPLVDVWDELHARYKKIPEWHDMYSHLRDAYSELSKEIESAVFDRINRTEAPDDVKLKVKKELMSKLLESAQLDPYFALGRRGDHWLGANWTENGQKMGAVKAFQSPLERSRFMEEISKIDPKARLDPYESINQVDFRNTPSGTLINDIFGILETNNIKGDVQEQMMRLFLSTLPETALMKSFKRRKGTEGYERNVLDTFMSKLRSTSHQIASMRYNPQLKEVVDLMQEHARQVANGTPEMKDPATGKTIPAVPARDNATEAAYAREFEQRLKYASSPQKHTIGDMLNTGAFTYTLGFNLSSGLTQAANLPMVVYPYLKGEYASGNIVRALADATRAFMGSGTKTEMPMMGGKPGETAKMNVGYSISNYTKGHPLYERYKTLVKVAEEQGQLNRSQLYEILNVDPNGGWMDKFKALSGMPMHYAERMNREITLMATFDLEMARLKANDPKAMKAVEAYRKNLSEDQKREVGIEEAKQLYAANRAVNMAEMTNGSISAASAPRISQTALGKVAYMYKRWAATYYYALFRSGKEALKNMEEGDRIRGMKQLGGAIGMAALMSGAQGIPLFGLASMVWSMFHDDDEEDLHTVTRKAIGEIPYKGLLDHYTNLAIASRISPNDLVVRDNPGSGGATAFSEQVAQIVGGPAYSTAERVVRGYRMLNEGHIERGVENLLPASAGNIFKSYRYATEGTTTLRGDPVSGDVSPYNVMAQAIGFSPADYLRQEEMNAVEKGVDKSVQQQASKIKSQYYTAHRFGDYEGMTELRQNLLDLGNRHPGLGLNIGTVDMVLQKSLAEQDKITKDMVNGVRYSKKMKQELLGNMEEWGQ